MANRRGILNNVTGVVYYFGMNIYLDWWRIAAGITINRSVGGTIANKAAWDAGIYLDPATGDLINPVPSDVTSIQKVFWTRPEAGTWVTNLNYDGETWFAEWDGSGTCTISGGGTGLTQSSITANKISFTFGTNGGNATATFAVTNRNDPPRNFRIYQARYAANMANGERFNPDWLKEAKQFGTLRLMDAMATNNSCITSISQMAGWSYHCWSQGYYDATTNPYQAAGVGQSGGGPKGSIHPEIICALAIAAGVPKIHICIPPYAPDQVVTDLATYFRDNLPSVVVVFERGNEFWNTGFYHFGYASKQGCRLAWGRTATSVTQGTTTRLTIPAHGIAQGTKLDTYCAASGWSSLEGKNKWASVVDANNIDLFNDSGLTTPFDSSGLTTYDGGETMVSSDFSRMYKWYGWRAAADMKIVRDVYNNRARWEGALGTFAVLASVTNSILVGVDYYLTNTLTPANSLVTNDLFNGVYTTNYFGGLSGGSKGISNITQANPGKVTCTAHGFSNGATLKTFIAAGMTQLNNQKVTITVVDVDNFTIGVDTTGYSAWAANGQNYCAPSFYWDLMDQSIALNGSNPATYPTKYSYYNQQMGQTMLAGVAALVPLWTAQYAVAKARGLELRAYEGGCHFLGDGFISAGGISTQFNEFLTAFGHSAENAAAYTAVYKGFVQCGGKQPSKFVDAGQTGRFGTWAGLRFMPLIANGNTDDTGNPVWQATRNWNDNLQPETWAARYGV